MRLLDVPANNAADPRARVYIIDHLAPGAVIHRRIAVSNTTGVTTHVTLYAAAASIVDGSFLGAAAHTPNDLSAMTSVSPASVDIRAADSVIATVTIKVPKDAVAGEKYAAVWAEARSTAGPAGGLTQVSRVGMRLYISIGPGGAPAASFTVNSLTAKRLADGQAQILASVHNTGGRALDMFGTLQLSNGPGALRAGPFPVTVGTTVTIGASEPVTTTLDKELPAGPWTVVLTMHSGLLTRTVHGTVTFPSAGSSAPAVQASPTTTHVSHLWASLAVGILGLILLAGLFWWFLILKRRRDKNRKPRRHHYVRPARTHAHRLT